MTEEFWLYQNTMSENLKDESLLLTGLECNKKEEQTHQPIVPSALEAMIRSVVKEFLEQANPQTLERVEQTNARTLEHVEKANTNLKTHG